MKIERIGSGTGWEARFGYCRAVKTGGRVSVAGTVAVDEHGEATAPGDAYSQTRRAFEIALAALAKLGGGLGGVIRTRMYVTDISRYEEYGRAHGEIFNQNPPVSTMVEVSALIAPAFLVEVEIEAVVGE